MKLHDTRQHGLMVESAEKLVSGVIYIFEQLITTLANHAEFDDAIKRERYDTRLVLVPIKPEPVSVPDRRFSKD